MPRLIENSTANDRVVPSAATVGPQSKDSGTILTIITKEEMTQLGIPMVIGDRATPNVGDIQNQRSMKLKPNGSGGGGIIRG